MSRIVLATFGSPGSIQPSIALGLGLRARGHEVTIAAGKSLHTKTEAYGLSFSPVRPDRSIVTADPEASRQTAQLKTGSAFAVKNLLRYVEETYADLLAACRGADLFISHPAAFCAPLVAEKLALPWLSLALAPATLFSATDPPVLPSMPWLARLPRVGSFPHSLIFRAFKKLTRDWMEPIDRLRAKAGLNPSSKHPFFEGMFSHYGTLGLFSRTLAIKQKDWPANTRLTGFPFCAEIDDRPLGDELDAFLSAGQPPVVFTLGSNVVREAGNFYNESKAAAERCGCRAVLLTGDDERNRIPPTRAIFTCSHAPYKNLFPRASAVVHQGGIGTTGHAMAAGVPMLIVPHVHDQPDNAYRVQRLGIARVESRSSYNAGSAASHLKTLLTQPAYKRRAQTVRSLVQTENGVASGCDAVEEVLSHG
jgi:UDP:flavonoid glycosyltransferase YjiC (YdhE family)